MADWDSPEELARDSAVFVNLMHVLLGLYIWEVFTSIDFDWQFLTGKRRFRWPMIFYFLNRYVLLAALSGIVASLDTQTRINCRSVFIFNQLAGNAAMGLASINLSLRTMAVWSQNKWVVSGLILLMFGHWSLILQGGLLQVQWLEGSGCAITDPNTRILAATFLYTMIFDLVVLSLNLWKVLRNKTQLARMLLGDGLIYFIVAFAANLIATVFMLVHLNQIMAIIFNVPAVVVSTIVAGRIIRRLSKFERTGAEMFAASSGSGTRNPRASVILGNVNRVGGVRVHMETFTRGDLDSPSTENNIGRVRFVGVCPSKELLGVCPEKEFVGDLPKDNCVGVVTHSLRDELDSPRLSEREFEMERKGGQLDLEAKGQAV